MRDHWTVVIVPCQRYQCIVPPKGKSNAHERDLNRCKRCKPTSNCVGQEWIERFPDFLSRPNLHMTSVCCRKVTSSLAKVQRDLKRNFHVFWFLSPTNNRAIKARRLKQTWEELHKLSESHEQFQKVVLADAGFQNGCACTKRMRLCIGSWDLCCAWARAEAVPRAASQFVYLFSVSRQKYWGLASHRASTTDREARAGQKKNTVGRFHSRASSNFVLAATRADGYQASTRRPLWYRRHWCGTSGSAFFTGQGWEINCIRRRQQLLPLRSHLAAKQCHVACRERIQPPQEGQAATDLSGWDCELSRRVGRIFRICKPEVINTSIAIYQSLSKALCAGRMTWTPWLIPFSASHQIKVR